MSLSISSFFLPRDYRLLGASLSALTRYLPMLETHYLLLDDCFAIDDDLPRGFCLLGLLAELLLDLRVLVFLADSRRFMVKFAHYKYLSK